MSVGVCRAGELTVVGVDVVREDAEPFSLSFRLEDDLRTNRLSLSLSDNRRRKDTDELLLFIFEDGGRPASKFILFPDPLDEPI